ncbi:MAG: DUF5301 domain-containing protein [Syntrophomonadaceae bacterium]|nr:DUF5301 domain-containing protein [Syntrophomonadaceae bacterium]
MKKVIDTKKRSPGVRVLMVALLVMALMGALVACGVPAEGDGAGQDLTSGAEEAAARMINADEIDEITLSMHYQGEQVSGFYTYPQENSEGIRGIVEVVNGAALTDKESVNDVPPYDRVIKVEFSPDKTVYIYRDGEKYYAETPYESIAELTPEAYETIREIFGPIHPFPEDADKTLFLAAIQNMLERYRSGQPPENQMEYMFAPAPPGVTLPEVDSTDDFELTDGYEESRYVAVIRFGENDAYSVRMGLHQIAEGGEKTWEVNSVSFVEPAD